MIETNQTRKRREATQTRAKTRTVPIEIHMAASAVREDQIDWPFPEHLIGHIGAAHGHEARLWNCVHHHGTLATRTPVTLRLPPDRERPARGAHRLRSRLPAQYRIRECLLRW